MNDILGMHRATAGNAEGPANPDNRWAIRLQLDFLFKPLFDTIATHHIGEGAAMKKQLWVLGDAVQDVTVEIDLELLLHEDASLRDSVVLDEALNITDGLWLTTQAGLHTYAVQMRVRNPYRKPDQNHGRAGLVPGEKYDLIGGVLESPDVPLGARRVSVRCEDVAWGGGGLNVARYIRALAPLRESVPIVYSDIAMSPPLDDLIQKELSSGTSAAHMLANHSAERYLEVYLDSMAIDAVLHQPVEPRR